MMEFYSENSLWHKFINIIEYFKEIIWYPKIIYLKYVTYKNDYKWKYKPSIGMTRRIRKVNEKDLYIIDDTNELIIIFKKMIVRLNEKER